MTDLDIEAIKARYLDVIVGIDHENPSKSTTTQLAYDVSDLLEEVERLRGQVVLAYQAGKLAERGEIFESEDDPE
ncbi:hypothetical protein [Rothia koreensis]|uniref:hypothetical protein n=1 Tax=Rothia koreensis TaxID=592378 RepID=UPI003FCD75B6